ncbi:oxidoreductase [Coniochaeta ligniaria NRRL 30616]|uniref:Oxidoreductase n=1 Tax=Coniochaeta ligniaria NRRL 30616 TaxID=1408157 RepID=A0A1J7IMG1_9PEZI|nr:oxidoreductase [Coniochaeta ligniaria NRRL 30616]
MPRALTLKQIEGAKPGKVYYPLQLTDHPLPSPSPTQLLIRILAAALNHRDLFQRQHLYPGISFTHPILADGCGVVVEAGSATSLSVGSRVLLYPAHGWESDPAGPESEAFSVVGGATLVPWGAGAEVVCVEESEVVVCPEHLSAAEGAALPLVGLTGWRALVSKSGIGSAEKGKGMNVLVTGIGGGVALQTMQFAVAMGCNVFVTSGDEEKIARAKGMGAKGGVVYKEAGWEKRLGAMLPGDRPWLDAVVDGAGGEVVGKTVRLLKAGGVIAQYGMTVGPRMDWVMQAVLRNVELRGTTMGSKREFGEMVEFVRVNKIRPVVSRTVRGIDNLEGIDGLFEDMKAGRQFGKLVIEFESPAGESSSPKL